MSEQHRMRTVAAAIAGTTAEIGRRERVSKSSSRRISRPQGVLGFLAVSLLSASVLMGFAPAPETKEVDEPITVSGKRVTPSEARHQADQFIRDVGAVTANRPAARWVDQVCPKAVGLSPAHAKIVETKMRKIALSADVPVARADCRGNIVVIFTTPASTMVRTIFKRAPKQFYWTTLPERRELLEGPAPVRWWYASATRGRDQRASTNAPAPWTAGNAEGGGSILPMGAEQSSLQQYSASLVSTQSVRALTNATVVVDVERAEGVTLNAVAAFAAMVAFSEVRGGGSPDGSILGLFRSAAHAVDDVTERDLAFLRSLYDLPLDRRAREHRRRLIRDLVKDKQGG